MDLNNLVYQLKDLTENLNSIKHSINQGGGSRFVNNYTLNLENQLDDDTEGVDLPRLDGGAELGIQLDDDVDTEGIDLPLLD